MLPGDTSNCRLPVAFFSEVNGEVASLRLPRFLLFACAVLGGLGILRKNYRGDSEPSQFRARCQLWSALRTFRKQASMSETGLSGFSSYSNERECW